MERALDGVGDASDALIIDLRDFMQAVERLNSIGIQFAQLHFGQLRTLATSYSIHVLAMRMLYSREDIGEMKAPTF